MDRYGVNIFLNAIIHALLTLHSASLKIIYVFKKEGIMGIFRGIKRWFLRKTRRK
jgi:hypothetical protein